MRRLAAIRPIRATKRREHFRFAQFVTPRRGMKKELLEAATKTMREQHGLISLDQLNTARDDTLPAPLGGLAKDGWPQLVHASIGSPAAPETLDFQRSLGLLVLGPLAVISHRGAARLHRLRPQHRRCRVHRPAPSTRGTAPVSGAHDEDPAADRSCDRRRIRLHLRDTNRSSTWPAAGESLRARSCHRLRRTDGTVVSDGPRSPPARAPWPG